MHILSVSYNLTLGGLEKVFFDYCNHFTQSGFRSSALTLKSAAINQALSETETATFHNGWIEKKYCEYNPFAVSSIRSLLEKVNPDVILTHNARPLQLLKKAANSKWPVAVVHHGGSVKRLDSACHTICVSKYMVADVIAKGFSPSKVHHVPNAIDCSLSQSRANLSNCNHILTVGFLGRLTKEKGADLLIDAIQYVSRPIKLLIAGDGPERAELETRSTGEEIEFLGWIDNDQKKQFLANCDVLVIPSRSESFGLSILEAWQSGVPVIATQTAGAPELITHLKDGVLVALNHPQALAGAIDNFSLEDSDKFAQRGWEKLLENYSFPIQAERLIQTVNQIIQQP